LAAKKRFLIFLERSIPSAAIGEGKKSAKAKRLRSRKERRGKKTSSKKKKKGKTDYSQFVGQTRKILPRPKRYAWGSVLMTREYVYKKERKVSPRESQEPESSGQ